MTPHAHQELRKLADEISKLPGDAGVAYRRDWATRLRSLAAPAPQGVSGRNYVLVPSEPTDAMIEAMRDRFMDDGDSVYRQTVRHAYDDMLDAAPSFSADHVDAEPVLWEYWYKQPNADGCLYTSRHKPNDDRVEFRPLYASSLVNALRAENETVRHILDPQRTRLTAEQAAHAALSTRDYLAGEIAILRGRAETAEAQLDDAWREFSKRRDIIQPTLAGAINQLQQARERADSYATFGQEIRDLIDQARHEEWSNQYFTRRVLGAFEIADLPSTGADHG